MRENEDEDEDFQGFCLFDGGDGPVVSSQSFKESTNKQAYNEDEENVCFIYDGDLFGGYTSEPQDLKFRYSTKDDYDTNLHPIKIIMEKQQPAEKVASNIFWFWSQIVNSINKDLLFEEEGQLELSSLIQEQLRV